MRDQTRVSGQIRGRARDEMELEVVTSLEVSPSLFLRQTPSRPISEYSVQRGALRGSRRLTTYFKKHIMRRCHTYVWIQSA